MLLILLVFSAASSVTASFGTTGYITYNVSPGDDELVGILVDSADNYVVCGQVVPSMNFDFGVGWISASTGALLNSSSHDFGLGLPDVPRSCTLDSSDNVYLVGFSHDGVTARVPAKLKFTPNGILDQAFDSTRINPGPNGDAELFDIAYSLNDDALYTVGYNSAGLLFVKFDRGGVVLAQQTHIDQGGSTYIGRGISFDTDWSPVVAGYRDTTPRPCIVGRLRAPDGLLDPGFNGGAFAVTTLGTPDGSTCYGVHTRYFPQTYVLYGTSGFTMVRNASFAVVSKSSGVLLSSFTSHAPGNVWARRVTHNNASAGTDYLASVGETRGTSDYLPQLVALRRNAAGGSLQAHLESTVTLPPAVLPGGFYAVAHDRAGNVVAAGSAGLGAQKVWLVARFRSDGALDVPTPSPTNAPTESPSRAPSQTPTTQMQTVVTTVAASTTGTPSVAPTQAPSSAPTRPCALFGVAGVSCINGQSVIMGTVTLPSNSTVSDVTIADQNSMIVVAGDVFFSGDLTLVLPSVPTSGTLTVVQYTASQGAFQGIDLQVSDISCGVAMGTPSYGTSSLSVAVTVDTTGCSMGLSSGALAGVIVGAIVVASVALGVPLYCILRGDTRRDETALKALSNASNSAYR